MKKDQDIKRLLMVGFGSIGQAVLPLIFKQFALSSEQVTIITATDEGQDVAKKYGISPIILPLTQQNYRHMILEYLQEGDVLLNLSVDISSKALIELSQEVGALYLDTCIEPWAGGYTNPEKSPAERSNYVLREDLLTLKSRFPKGPTALVAHGANPGLVSHFVKQAMLDIANDIGLTYEKPTHREGWAKLANELEIKVIHVAEQDTQILNRARLKHEFLNTWSVEGFIGEGAQPAELGWGSHEKHFPEDGAEHAFGCGAAIYLKRPGLTARVRSWTPRGGAIQALLITHNEAISLSDYLTVKSGKTVTYRPTVYYSYQPSDVALLSVHDFLGNNMQKPATLKVIREEIVAGMDELGVLLMGHAKNAYWFGSQLTIEEARSKAPYNSATSLQVAAGVLSGLVWVLNHPNEGIVEPEDMDFEEAIDVALPYLGKLTGTYTDWTPLKNRVPLFDEPIDKQDPWQFVNFRLS